MFSVHLRCIKEMERAVERTKSAKEERVREMRRAVEQMIERLDGQLRSVVANRCASVLIDLSLL